MGGCVVKPTAEKRKWKCAEFYACIEGGEVAEYRRCHVRGWACEIDGIEFIVHRPFWTHRKEVDVPEPPGWSVSEPGTGLLIADGSALSEPAKTREQAIWHAENKIALEGGPSAVRRAIATLKEAARAAT